MVSLALARSLEETCVPGNCPSFADGGDTEEGEEEEEEQEQEEEGYARQCRNAKCTLQLAKSEQ